MTIADRPVPGPAPGLDAAPGDVKAAIEMVRDPVMGAGISPSGLQQLVESNEDGVLVVDQGGAILFANPAAAEILGRPRNALIGVTLGRPMVSGETTDITVKRPGQSVAEVELRATEIFWGGQPALLASLRDASARRAQEERRRQAEKLEAIGRLTAGVAHDLNNFVTVIQSGLRLLQKRIGTDPKTGMLIEELFKGTARGAALIQRLLTLSRKQPPMPQAVDLNALIGSLMAFLERTLGRGIAIRLKLDPGLDQVFVDPTQLEVAILNLAVNAKDAMEGNGVLRIETSRRTQQNEPSLPAPAGGLVCLTIGDTGCGMSKEVLAQVFEPFFTTKAEGQGTGLGLSQVHGFVTQSGGHIRIDSEVGKGTNVHLLLPRLDTAGPGVPSVAGKD